MIDNTIFQVDFCDDSVSRNIIQRQAVSLHVLDPRRKTVDQLEQAVIAIALHTSRIRAFLSLNSLT